MGFEQCSVMIVDDVIENIKVAMGDLETLHVKVIYATNGEQALLRVQNTKPNLILMDIAMPKMDGIETVKRIKEITTLEHIPIIFLTAKSDIDDIKRGFEVGGVDYITKPFHGEELLSRIKTHLELSLYRHDLEEQVQERTAQIDKLKSSIIEAMGSLAEYRDNETGAHIQRTQEYVKILCNYLSNKTKYKDLLCDEYIDLLFRTAPLHDIGKVGIRDHILLKPGKLTDEEFAIMKQHAIFGENVIDRLIKKNGKTDFLLHAKEIAGGHHEKWDGSGYPRGLKGEEIPFSARIMALADVYDALISERVYKKAFSHQEAVDLISKGKGSHFDPELVEAFLDLHIEFQNIAQKNKDDHKGA